MKLTCVALVVTLLGACAGTAQGSGDPLERGFQDPPNSAKPRAWWFLGDVQKRGT